MKSSSGKLEKVIEGFDPSTFTLKEEFTKLNELEASYAFYSWFFSN